MKIDTIESDTLAIEDGEWDQLLNLLGSDGLRAKRIVVKTESGTLELTADYASPHGLDVVVKEPSEKTNKEEA